MKKAYDDMTDLEKRFIHVAVSKLEDSEKKKFIHGFHQNYNNNSEFEFIIIYEGYELDPFQFLNKYHQTYEDSVAEEVYKKITEIENRNEELLTYLEDAVSVLRSQIEEKTKKLLDLN